MQVEVELVFYWIVDHYHFTAILSSTTTSQRTVVCMIVIESFSLELLVQVTTYTMFSG